VLPQKINPELVVKKWGGKYLFLYPQSIESNQRPSSGFRISFIAAQTSSTKEIVNSARLWLRVNEKVYNPLTPTLSPKLGEREKA